jgi:S-adenosylmethionine:tRNA ribosyltransferase-isomerase
MKTEDFDYHLPEELIAQFPLEKRTDSRMMVLDRAQKSIAHSQVLNLAEHLREGDLLVFNNTKVFPARTTGVREDTGGKVEMVFVRQLGEEASSAGGFASEWLCIFGSGSKTRVGQKLSLCGGAVKAELTVVLDQGHVEASICTSEPIMDLLEREGQIPLPPYIGRKADSHDKSRYQTVYASESGAVAAPTAGLHFTEELFEKLDSHGIRRCSVTLHVGPGTFLPVKVEDVEAHKMHSEIYCVEAKAADAINSARTDGGRIIAVGTTSVRTLEGVWSKHGGIVPDEGETDIFIYPPHEFKAVDGMFTNFHLPKSTLLMMISAFAGKEYILEAYGRAIEQRYRFYSYGDCMLIT